MAKKKVTKKKTTKKVAKKATSKASSTKKATSSKASSTKKVTASKASKTSSTKKVTASKAKSSSTGDIAAAIAKASAIKVNIPEVGNMNWNDIHEKYKGSKSASYDMKKDFKIHTGVQHKTFGWGFVLSSYNNRLEVIFQSGIKQLIYNYK